MRRGLLAGLVAALVSVAVPLARAADEPACAWPMYGHDLDHSFSQDPGCAEIDALTVRTLVPKWVVPTKDSVTASPTVVDGVVYVGSWDGIFYAIDAESGAVRWTFTVPDTKKVAFGRIVSSAAVARFPENDGTRKVVMFGGGSTLYALDAVTGALLAEVDLDPRQPELREAQAANPPDVEIESSPAVVGDRVFVGMDVHNDAGTGRTGIVSLRFGASDGTWAFEPQWKFDPETNNVYTGPGLLTEGSGQGFGCGGVWSSPAVDVDQGLIFFGTANCNNVEEARAAGENWAESTFAIRMDTGALVWRYRPAENAPFVTEEQQNAEAHADDDFGASPNILRLGDGRTFWGHGRKSATYYAFDTATGEKVWQTQAGHHGRVGENFSLGGFLGTPAVQRADDGTAVRVVGATAVPIPRTDQSEWPDSVDRSTWAVKAMDPVTGDIEWIHRLGAPAYGAPTIANGVVFVPNTFTATLQALDAATGLLLWAAPVPPSSSAPAVVGDSVYLGGGTRETDAEYKGIRDSGVDTQAVASVLGPHPLSPASGIFAFHLAAG